MPAPTGTSRGVVPVGARRCVRCVRGWRGGWPSTAWRTGLQRWRVPPLRSRTPRSSVLLQHAWHECESCSFLLPRLTWRVVPIDIGHPSHPRMSNTGYLFFASPIYPDRVEGNALNSERVGLDTERKNLDHRSGPLGAQLSGSIDTDPQETAWTHPGSPREASR